MSETPRVQQYYFTSYYLAGDFIWSVSAASFFLALASVIFPELRPVFLRLIKGLDSFDSSFIVIAGLAIYVLIGAVAGAISHRAARILRDLFRLRPGMRERLGYNALYRRKAEGLRLLYEYHFWNNVMPLESSPISLNEIVNRLILYMKLYNPEGYNRIYRSYSVVAMFRQSLIYSLMLIAGAVWFSPDVRLLLLVLLIVILSLCLRFAVEHSAGAELDFIVATSQWLADQARFVQT